MQKRKGFTLIELLVVIAIIALLATIAVVAFSGAQLKARDSKRMADVQSVVSALNSAYQDDSTNVLCKTDCTSNTTFAVTDHVSLARICKTACNSGTDVTSNYSNLGLMKDPVTGNYTTLCTGANTGCDYAFKAGSTITAPIIYFFTEGNMGQLTGPAGHTANQNGISQ
jgi:prepilin-type N-terminal cleavage/methylation domain-containing protein